MKVKYAVLFSFFSFFPSSSGNEVRENVSHCHVVQSYKTQNTINLKSELVVHGGCVCVCLKL